MEQDKNLSTALIHFPAWPSSKPGPKATPPPAGEKPMGKRTEQMVDLAFEEEQGIPGTLHDEKLIPNVPQTSQLASEQENTIQSARRGKKRR